LNRRNRLFFVTPIEIKVFAFSAFEKKG